MNTLPNFCYYHSLTKYSENFKMLQQWFKNSLAQSGNVNVSIPVLNQHPTPCKRRRHSYSRRRQSSSRREPRRNQEEPHLNESLEWSEEGDDDIEISEEWGKMLEISARHRNELKKQRLKEEKEQIKEPEINVLAEFTEMTSQMKDLYGSSSPMIHGMETSLQINYDRYLDDKQPKAWPVLPFNP